MASKLPSGCTLEEAGDAVMRLYCKRTAKIATGILRPAPPFKYQDTTPFISQKQKWEETMSTNRTKESKDRVAVGTMAPKSLHPSSRFEGTGAPECGDDGQVVAQGSGSVSVQVVESGSAPVYVTRGRSQKLLKYYHTVSLPICAQSSM